MRWACGWKVSEALVLVVVDFAWKSVKEVLNWTTRFGPASKTLATRHDRRAARAAAQRVTISAEDRLIPLQGPSAPRPTGADVVNFSHKLHYLSRARHPVGAPARGRRQLVLCAPRSAAASSPGADGAPAGRRNELGAFFKHFTLVYCGWALGLDITRKPCVYYIWRAAAPRNGTINNAMFRRSERSTETARFIIHDGRRERAALRCAYKLREVSLEELQRLLLRSPRHEKKASAAGRGWPRAGPARPARGDAAVRWC
ncbi:hypothetical protein EVAR_47477_1 [Eumeta japonica]|uniref:Uncharacterized protein n=1 Tax=Eumeta variegata TaxID=151549 RepID=A0A4C1XEJ5_EUMVA|nr:hypothetical protein EVAR_47477_1 [Eumeta japonica]